MSGEAAENHAIVLFDGVCNLCSGLVQFIVPRDPEGTFRFASLQSDVAADLVESCDVSTDELDSIVVIEGDECYVKSAAVIRIAARLGGIYSLVRLARILPRSIRDWGYDRVANRRYRWFGQKDQCMIPTGDVEQRFLETADEP